MTAKPGAPRVLSIFGSLGHGAPQADRFVRMANGFGGRLRHFVVAGDGDYAALEGIEKGVPIERLGTFPKLTGLPLPGRLQQIARALLDYHLVLTWGWGAMDAALAHTMFSEVHALPPLIHHEDGSDETPQQRSRARSKWYRRVGLGKSSGVVVPTELMEGVALVDWQQPLGRVKTIRDGVALDRADRRRKGEGLGRLIKRDGELWMGCFPSYSGREDFAPIVKALESCDLEWNFVLVGDGPRRGEIEALLRGSSVEHRVHFHTDGSHRSRALGLFDALVLGGGADPLPIQVIEAMGAGLAVCGADPGEVSVAVSQESAAFVTKTNNADEIAALVVRLTGDRYLREQAGKANRELAKAQRDAKAMIASYRRLYASAMGRESI